MNDEGWPRSSEARTPAEAQTAMVLEEYGDYVEPGPPDWRETGGIRYFVRRGFVLAREESAARAREILAAAHLRPRDDAERIAALHPGAERRPEEPRDGDAFHGLRYLRLGAGRSVFDALRVLRNGLFDTKGRRTHDPLSPGDVGPEHLLHLTDHTGVCPADEPGHVPPHTPPDPPPTGEHRAGEGIRILVIDTGLDPQAAAKPWLAGVTGDPDPGVGGGGIKRYAGHGTFIAGVIRTVAPAAEVIVRAGLPGSLFGPATNPPGTAFERELAASLEHGLVHDHPDVISLSAGTLTDDPAKLMVLEAFHDGFLHRYKGVVLVAAAGNDGGRAPFWPAASRWAVGVGALAAHWRARAGFSNFGSWVDVYAPGERLVNAFPSGVYTYTEPPRRGVPQRFEGMATWSGTSFSTPMVAGLIAARMSCTGENGPAAAAALIAQARRDAIPGVGAVLLPPPGQPHHCRINR
ncbi:S8/S53 family peptidase [Dactylosporangium sp. NPDC049140]|uniref:S8 family peptidase n=1 Tax=Dactylosporangium sp. NPDC049140 TaxID=3155647 RepID=UPI0033CBC54F